MTASSIVFMGVTTESKVNRCNLLIAKPLKTIDAPTPFKTQAQHPVVGRLQSRLGLHP
jgi:hypothetical protein